MPKRRSKSRASSQSEEEERPRSRRSTQSVHDDDDDAEDDGAEEQFMFSQQMPEMSQDVAPERPAERKNLDSMDPAARDKALTSVSRLILMKALERQVIDRLKIPKEAGVTNRIGSVAFQEATDRLHNVFGFELKRIPKYIEEQKSMPPKFKDRYYVINGASKDNDHGSSHSKAIHSAHQDSAMEKGFLMLTLALIFCKGESHADGSRWALSRDLYRLLHSMDDSIPEEPPQQGTARAKAVDQKSRLRSKNMTPNVDHLLEKFTHQDYLVKVKATEDNYATQTLEEGDVLYSMGPRAAMEVGRKQVIHFCAEVLGEEPDPTMLAEVEADEEEVEDEVYMEELEQTM